jgi:purine-binding chemotaxis protein CheW
MSTTDTEARDYTRAQDVNQFLTFTLKGEEFGIEILRVQEIKGYSTVTPIPNAPPHIKGVMNLRGTVVPVVDLRSRFAMAETEADQFTVIIVVRVGKRVVGLVVDAVSDVLNIGAGDVEAPPEMGQDVDISFLTGVAKSGERLTLLLDIEKVVGNDAEAAQA